MTKAYMRIVHTKKQNLSSQKGAQMDPKVLKIGIPKMNATKLKREPKWIQKSEIGIQKDADGCRIRFKTYVKRLPEGCLNRSKSQLKKYP